MKAIFVAVAALCLSLTACGIDSNTVPAHQPTDQVTEQTAPAASVCKASEPSNTPSADKGTLISILVFIFRFGWKGPAQDRT